MLKRLLSVILAAAILPVITVDALEEEFDTDIFGNNAACLLEEHFAETFTVNSGDVSNSRPSGWDIDYRGGTVIAKNRNLNICDTSLCEKISLRHEIIPVKSGKLTFETAVMLDAARGPEFIIRLGGGKENALELKLENGGIYSLCGEKIKLTSFSGGEKLYIRAELDLACMETSLTINKSVFSLQIPSGCQRISEVVFSTGEKSECSAHLYFVNAYRNYLVREKFMLCGAGEIPQGFSLSPSGSESKVAYAPGSPYRDDTNGFSLKNSSAVPEVSLSKNFETVGGDIEASFAVMFPQKQDGVSFLLTGESQNIEINTKNGNIYAGSSMLQENYRANLWYSFKISVSSQNGSCKISVNFREKAALSYAGGKIFKIAFSKSAEDYGEVLIDDIEITRAFERYADYPSEPETVESGGANVGMVMYPMWREGMHFGWDTVSPYASERKPLLGFYTEGQREVSDWQNKWMLEHGIDYAVYPFVRPNSDSGEPVKKPTRSEDLTDGYMNSQFSDRLKFAVFLSAFSQFNYHGADEFIENVIPYLSEYYFSNPKYMKINNKLPIFCYSFSQMVKTLGGAKETEKVISALENEAKSLGYAGIIFGADAASASGHTAVESVGGELHIWSYGANSDNVQYIKQRISEEYAYSENYIASIPMGYDETPWRSSKTGFLTPDEIKELCRYVKNKNEFKASDEKMILFTCWNEYGEGHFYAPASKAGFDYLNAIRSTLTEAGEKSDEAVPGSRAVARMSALYPNGRGALKTLADRKFTEQDMANREVLLRYKFSAENAALWKSGNCTVKFTDSGFEGTAVANDPMIFTALNTGIDISKVKAIKIRAFVKGGHDLRVFYTTSDNPSFGSGKVFYADRIPSSDEYGEFVLYPFDIAGNSAYSEPTGTITGFRIDPADDLYLSGGGFGIDYFELIGETNGVKLIVNGTEANLTTQTKTAENTVLLPIYSVLLNELEAYAVWNEPEKTLTVQKSGETVVVTAGSRKVLINGREKTWQTAPVYEDGNIFVPYSEFFAALGYSAEFDADTNAITVLPQEKMKFSLSAVENGYGGNILRTFDDAYISDCSFVNLAKSFNSQTVSGKDAIVLKPQTAGTDALFNVEFVNYKGKRCRLNEVIKECEKIRVSFSYKGICSGISVENRASDYIDEKRTISGVSENEWRNFSYEFDCSNINSESTANRWLTIRVLSGQTPSPMLCISDYSLQCYGERETKEYNETVNFRITAPTDQKNGENVVSDFVDEKIKDFGFFRINEAFNNETVGGKTAIKLVPCEAGTDGLFSVIYINLGGERQKLNSLIALGGKMRVSFSYMGRCSEVYVENREAALIGEKTAIKDISENEWKSFSYVFDNSDITVSSQDARWLSVRIKSDNISEPYLYLSDFKIQSYDEDMEEMYSLIVAEYNQSGALVRKTELFSGNTADSGEYTKSFLYTPENQNAVKAFLWSKAKPLCGAWQLTKNKGE